MERIIVDRIEDGIAVCELEDGKMKNIALSSLPEGTHEGSVLTLKRDGSLIIDTAEENKRKERLLKIQDSLFDE